ncbi:glycosyltransferase [Ktedonosporobacter rubrisoli]|uniref:4,4'-diaponeurosporenoate glycosyltransferase n=1 Tax=Ktedonosporobacter rubrisoli TaxID=2509675 RepID=A0A4V0YYT7_KTERU|nr:glycosyltransferase family 2 protein [Ktedonosporobacter rubrisoli]QBD77361.1 glycosyltransferase [Ktedonosporobacter rubrisoli]
MKSDILLTVLGLAQFISGLRVVKRLLSTARGTRLQLVMSADLDEAEHLSVIIPVLNESHRLPSCLQGLRTIGREVSEILVVDGGSCDGTQDLVLSYQQRDPRIRLLDASPIPQGWNGKVWGLHIGLRHVEPTSSWVLTLDADVRPSPWLVCSLLAHMHRTGLTACSLATRQEIDGLGQALLHPALLTTLVYRFGIPGYATRSISAIQANGQCFLVRRETLESCGGFACVRDSVCEDITLARELAASGHQIGFYEAEDLISVRMYEDWRDTWRNWPRSLPMHDRFSGWQTLSGWLEIALVQAAPLPLFLMLLCTARRNRWLLLLNAFFTAMRIGVLYGTSRAYSRRPWSYWLSPLCDLPVAFKVGISAMQHHYIWRGRILIRGGKR